MYTLIYHMWDKTIHDRNIKLNDVIANTRNLEIILEI